jgi:hypothetical protein
MRRRQWPAPSLVHSPPPCHHRTQPPAAFCLVLCTDPTGGCLLAPAPSTAVAPIAGAHPCRGAAGPRAALAWVAGTHGAAPWAPSPRARASARLYRHIRREREREERVVRRAEWELGREGEEIFFTKPIKGQQPMWITVQMHRGNWPASDFHPMP